MAPNYVGEVHTVIDTKIEKVLEWRVKNLFAIKSTGGISPNFKFLDYGCNMTVEVNAPSSIRLCLHAASEENPSPPKIYPELALKKSDGTQHEMPATKDSSYWSKEFLQLYYHVLWCEFADQKETFFPGGVMTLVCRMSTQDPKGDPAAQGGASEQLQPSSDIPGKRERTALAAKGKPNRENNSWDEGPNHYGDVKVGVASLSRVDVTWKVPDFFNLPCDLTTGVLSPRFNVRGSVTFFALHPYGTYETKGCIQLTLAMMCERGKGMRNPELLCEMSLKRADGTFYRSLEGEEEDQVGDIGIVLRRCFRLSEVVAERESLLPDGVLTVHAKLGNDGNEAEGAAAAASGTVSLSQAASEATTHENSDLGDLVRVLKSLSVVGEDKNITIMVKGQEFRTFMSILRARAPVFASEVDEKLGDSEDRTLDISDLCDLTTFRAFMDFVHSGKVKQPLSADTIFELYVMADRYQLDKLKELCIESSKRERSKPFILAA